MKPFALSRTEVAQVALLVGRNCASTPTAIVGDALGHPSLALRVKQMTGREVRSGQSERFAEDNQARSLALLTCRRRLRLLV